MADASIHVERSAQGKQGEYRVTLEGASQSATLGWRDEDGVRHAEHTFVPPDYRGKGVAGRLVEALVEDARTQGFKIAPDCSYVANWFTQHPDAADLRA